MLGLPVVDISLDYDQSIGMSTIDGRTWTRLSPYGFNDADDLGLPASNIVLGASYSYGRDRFIVGDFETGLATVILNNDNGEWSPESGVNTIGGDKLQPGMLLRIAYYLHRSDIETYLDAVTPYNWGTGSDGNGVYSESYAPTDASTVTGFVDGRTWTVNVATPGDIDVEIGFGPTNDPPGDSQAGWNRFVGRILRVEDRYDEGGLGSVTVLTVADLMADMAQYQPGALGTPRAAEATDDRWIYLANAALNATNLRDLGTDCIYDVESSDLAGNYLEEARITARAEGGAVYADHSARGGALVFKGANWLKEQPRSAVVQAAIGNTRIGIVAASTEYTMTRVFNDLYYANSSTESNQSDATSIADYSTRALRRTVLNNDNTDLATIATRDLALLKDAKLVVTSVTIRPNNLFEEVFCATVAIGDLLEVTIENNGWSYSQDLHVAGIAEAWDAASGDWSCVLRLDSRSGDTVIS